MVMKYWRLKSILFIRLNIKICRIRIYFGFIKYIEFSASFSDDKNITLILNALYYGSKGMLVYFLQFLYFDYFRLKR